MSFMHDKATESPFGYRLSVSRAWRAGLVFVLTLILASSWLIFPYFFEGERVLQDVSAQVTQDRNSQQRTLGQTLTRLAMGPGEVDVDVLYATDIYFQRTSTPRAAAQYGADRNHVFVVNEGVHVGELHQALPEAVLLVDGVAYDTVDMDGPEETDHHRTTFFRFPRTDAAGKAIVGPDARRISLRISN